MGGGLHIGMWEGGAGKEERMKGTGTRFEGRLEMAGSGGSGGKGCWWTWAISGIAGQNKELAQTGRHTNNAVKIT